MRTGLATFLIVAALGVLITVSVGQFQSGVSGSGERLETIDHVILRPGMYAEVVVRVREIADTLVVPGAAILERVSMDGIRTDGIFVADGELARWVPVQVSGRSGNLAAIEAALEGGEQVLTLGHSELEDGGRIRVVGAEGSA